MSNTTDQKHDAPADACNANFADVASELAAALATAESLPAGVYGEAKYGECRWLTKEEIAAQAHKADVPVTPRPVVAMSSTFAPAHATPMLSPPMR